MELFRAFLPETVVRQTRRISFITSIVATGRALLPYMRGLSRDVLLYGLGTALARLFTLIAIPVYTRILRPGDFGLLNLILAFVALAISVLGVGGDTAYARFFFRARSRAEKQAVTSTWIGFLFILNFFAVLAAMPFVGVADTLFGRAGESMTLALVLAMLPIAITNRMCAQVARNEARPLVFACLTVAVTASPVIVAVATAMWIVPGVRGVALGMLVGELIVLPFHLAAARRLLRLTFSVAILRRMLRFGIPIIPMSLAYWVFLTSDRFLIARYANLHEVALYGVAAALTSVLILAQYAFGQAWVPHYTRLFEEDPRQAHSAFQVVMPYALGGIGGCAFLLVLFARELVSLLAPAQYSDASTAVVPLALGNLAYALVPLTAGGIYLANRTRLFAIFAWVAAGLNIGLNLAAIPRFGMLGAAWATAVSYCFLSACYHVASQRLWRVDYPHRILVGILATVIVGTVIAGAMPRAQDLQLVGVKLLYGLGVVLILGLLARHGARTTAEESLEPASS